MRSALTISLLLYLGSPQAGEARLLITRLPLAGSQYYALDANWNAIKPGDALVLRREPQHRKDSNAIRVEWQGQQIGYVPRQRNRALALALDSGEILTAEVIRTQSSRDPWLRLEFAVFSGL